MVSKSINGLSTQKIVTVLVKKTVKKGIKNRFTQYRK